MSNKNPLPIKTVIRIGIVFALILLLGGTRFAPDATSSSTSSCLSETFTFIVMPNFGQVFSSTTGATYSSGGGVTLGTCNTSISGQAVNLASGYAFMLWSSNGVVSKTNPATISGCDSTVSTTCSVTVYLYLTTVGNGANGWCCWSNKWDYPNQEIVEPDPYALSGTSGETGALYMDEYQPDNANPAWNFTSTIGNIPRSVSGVVGYGDIYYGIGQFTCCGGTYWKNTSIVSTMKLPMNYSGMVSDNLYIYSEYRVNNNNNGKSSFAVTTDNWLFPVGHYMTGNYPSAEIMVMPFEQNFIGCTRLSTCPSVNGGTLVVNGQSVASSAYVFHYWCNSGGVAGRDGIQIRFRYSANWKSVSVGFNFSQIAISSVSYLRSACGTSFPTSNMWLTNLYWGVEYQSYRRTSIFSVLVDSYYTTSYAGATNYLS